MADFYQLMDKTCQVRRQIAERVLKGIPIRAHFSVSLENAKVSSYTLRTKKKEPKGKNSYLSLQTKIFFVFFFFNECIR